ncbi:TonB-dependent receptor [Mucilaginibacter sp. SMC90]|uniref:SusC/RagA family TonB-linked outer membrane protein n=1 Tax=Mucilaginibacter sp. SMC90 TaxID=2929803 RepID=UPI001FB43FDF|nr:TonB-dependent receptor [Mucilaginibacter sp. SMC90]UOE46804.1 TonB-dependent receptor [Mucilaginibacter sp. SMC90]
MRKNYSKKYVLLCAFLMMSFMAFSQTGSIKGKVSDETNQPLPGATVTIDGTTIGSTTDPNGNYAINNVKAGTYTLSIKFIGYITLKKTVTVNGALIENFTVQPESKSLNEVVVIGYGTQRKKDLSGSITNVTAKDFQKGVITTPEQLIAGKVAGVSVISNSGAPGSGSKIRIRGGASLSASNDPLIVIDGVPLDNARNADGTSKISGVADPLSLINPNDIESFSVLKDASATAIYGNRASNGVILITTKKGKKGKPTVDFSSQFSVSKLGKEVSVLTADQLRDYVKANGTTAQQALLGTANTDWQKQIYQTAQTTDNNISVSGATKVLPYRISAGYLNQEGVLKTGSLKRFTGAINLSPSFFTDHLKVNLNVKGANVKQRFANEGAIGAAVSFNPTLPVYSGSNRFGGYYEWLDPSSVNGLKSLAPLNPLGLLEQRDDKSNVYRSIGNLTLDYKFHFLPELHANVNLGYDVSNGRGTVFVSDSAASGYKRYKDANGVFHGGTNTQYKQLQSNKIFEGYLSYAKDIKDIKSHIDAIAGYSYQDFLTTSYNFPDVTADGTIVSKPIYPYDKPENRLISVYGRLNYIFDDKYILTGTIRRDGSSRFAPDRRYGTFPSAAFAWKMINEDFLKGSKTVSDLKLRLGWGKTGQQDIGENYSYISYYNLSNNTAQYQLGNTFYNLYRPGGYYPNRKWEETTAANIGFDFGFIDNRITGTIDYYHRKTSALLNNISQPAGSNFSNEIVANIGNATSSGFEFNINADIIRSTELTWSVGLNATYNQNKITKLTIAPDPNYAGAPVGGISGGTGQNIQINSVNYPRYSFYVYQQVYGPDGKPLDGVFVDRNNDGIINNQDLYQYKSPDPKGYFGLTSNVNYKQWSAGFTARASVGNYAYNNVFSSTGTQRSIINPIGVINNGSTNVLQSGLTGSSDKNVLSDYYIQNASFIRMDNINVGYNFGKVFKNAGVLRLSANVQNVFVITKYKGVDPEIGTGIDNNLYPRPRTYVLGLNLSL